MEHNVPRPTLPPSVRIVEVAPRDGLQNEAQVVTTANKVQFIKLLASSGLHHIEVTSFVRPSAIPQLADASEVMAALPQREDVLFSALVPNTKGMERALAAGVREIALFTGASETFVQHNINTSIAGSLENFAPSRNGPSAWDACTWLHLDGVWMSIRGNSSSRGCQTSCRTNLSILVSTNCRSATQLG